MRHSDEAARKFQATTSSDPPVEKKNKKNNTKQPYNPPKKILPTLSKEKTYLHSSEDQLDQVRDAPHPPTPNQRINKSNAKRKKKKADSY